MVLFQELFVKILSEIRFLFTFFGKIVNPCSFYIEIFNNSCYYINNQRQNTVCVLAYRLFCSLNERFGGKKDESIHDRRHRPVGL